MRNLQALFTIFLSLGSLYAQAQKEFTIEGRLKGVADGTVIKLARSDGDLLTTISVDTLQNETFHFTAKADNEAPEAFKLMGRGKGFPTSWVDVWVVPGAKITVYGENKLLRTWAVNSSIEEQKTANRYKDATRELTDALQQIMCEEQEIFKKARGEASDSLKQVIRNRRAVLRHQTDSVDKQITSIELKIMNETPVSRVWLDKLNDLAMRDKYMPGFSFKKETLALYGRLSKAEKESEQGKTITTFLFPPTVVKAGEQMADADLYDLQGNIHHLADFKGKFMLLDFWSRGCGPCIMALPEMKEVSQNNKEQLTVISISIDKEKNWKEISKTKNMTWQNLNELQGYNGLYAKYGVRGIPHYVLISPEGKILHSWSGYAEGLLKRKLRKWVNPVKRIMSIRQSGASKIVDYPTEESSNTETLEVEQVTLTDTATIVRLKAYYTPNYWIQISPASYLKTADGTHYAVKKAEGLKLGEHFFLPASGEAIFTLFFTPLPANTSRFDFTEGEDEGCYTLKGLSLVK
ncbi:MAG: TlpA disulfide reductase family protein [Bacteroides sp.]